MTTEDDKHRAKYAVFNDLFSSGMCTAIICSGSRHWITQPCLSLTRAVSTLRKVFGMRLHSTATMVCTSRRGGHCGTGFLCSLLKMAEERGMASCEVSQVWELEDWTSKPHFTALLMETITVLLRKPVMQEQLVVFWAIHTQAKFGINCLSFWPQVRTLCAL